MIEGMCCWVLLVLGSGLPTVFGEARKHNPVQLEDPSVAAEHMRNVLQAKPLCAWDAGSCRPDILGSIPDQAIVKDIEKEKKCLKIAAERKCMFHGAGCVWLSETGVCLRDITKRLQSCLVPEWRTLRRSLECQRLGAKRQCKRVDGCLWDPESKSCNIDEEAILQAINGNGEVSSSFGQLRDCIVKPQNDCNGNCTSIDGVCVFSPAVDINLWFQQDLDDSLCLYLKEFVSCQTKSADDCSGQCQASKIQNRDVCELSSAALIDTAFKSDLDLQKRMLAGLQECPKFTSEDDCLSYT